MENVISEQMILDHIEYANQALNDLTHKYLCYGRCGYDIELFEIEPPDPVHIAAQEKDLEKGVRYFLSEVLEGSMANTYVATETEAQALDARRTEQRSLESIFMATILDTLRSLDAEFYMLTDDGKGHYYFALDMLFWPVDVELVRIQNKWFALLSVYNTE